MVSIFSRPVMISNFAKDNYHDNNNFCTTFSFALNHSGVTLPPGRSLIKEILVCSWLVLIYQDMFFVFYI